MSTHGARTKAQARPPPDVVAKRKAGIARRYEAKRHPIDRDKLICGKRRNDIEDAILGLFGGLPDTDDRDLLLRFWAMHNFRSYHQERDLIALAERLGAKLSEAEAEAVVSYCNRYPRKFKARHLGKLLGLTEEVRHAMGITTIKSIDVTPAQRKRINKSKHADKVRRLRDRKPREQWLAENSLSRTKPWEAEGIHKATWYRRKGRGATGVCRSTFLLPVHHTPVAPSIAARRRRHTTGLVR